MSKNNAQGRTIVGSAAYLGAASTSLKSNLVMADSNRFKIGDVVRLKSGGLVMTISNFDERGRPWCVWFVDDEKQWSYFQLESLALVTEEESE